MRIIYLPINISEFENLEEEKIKAEFSEKLKSDFIVSIYNEIKEPLNLILNSSEQLFNSNLSISEQKDFIYTISEKGYYLNNYINKIIEIIKIENKEIKINSSLINLNELFDDIKEDIFKNTEKVNNKIFIIKGSDDINSKIYTDQILLKQVIKLILEIERNQETHMINQISIEIQVPKDFPDNYKNAIIKTASLCTVTKHLEKPPNIDISVKKNSN